MSLVQLLWSSHFCWRNFYGLVMRRSWLQLLNYYIYTHEGNCANLSTTSSQLYLLLLGGISSRGMWWNSLQTALHSLEILFLVCTWRHGGHVGGTLTKECLLASIVLGTNMAAMSLYFEYPGIDCKPSIPPISRQLWTVDCGLWTLYFMEYFNWWNIYKD